MELSGTFGSLRGEGGPIAPVCRPDAAARSSLAAGYDLDPTANRDVELAILEVLKMNTQAIGRRRPDAVVSGPHLLVQIGVDDNILGDAGRRRAGISRPPV